ncbi:c-type cytochrome [Burkholderia guangdongensis]|uniref:c-type cytochrome n=1 Tax=Burkholderia guangdongensis TaxID=1792500 RepID=UPI0015CD8E33|nr:c-type cytochrome [Burkholderia guangdongensis]
MKRSIVHATLLTLLVASAAARAGQADGLALAQQRNCMACHAVSKPLMGPSFHDIADKYATRGDAADYLAQAIVKGSSGVWGGVPMPANTQLSNGEAHTLASWVLSLR